MGEGGAVDAPAQPVDTGERQDAVMGEQMKTYKDGLLDAAKVCEQSAISAWHSEARLQAKSDAASLRMLAAQEDRLQDACKHGTSFRYVCDECDQEDQRCERCHGNLQDAPCAYPNEQAIGCLKDKQPQDQSADDLLRECRRCLQWHVVSGTNSSYVDVIERIDAHLSKEA